MLVVPEWMRFTTFPQWLHFTRMERIVVKYFHAGARLASPSGGAAAAGASAAAASAMIEMSRNAQGPSINRSGEVVKQQSSRAVFD